MRIASDDAIVVIFVMIITVEIKARAYLIITSVSISEDVYFCVLDLCLKYAV